jgi:DnaJ-class molecular chaperone
MTCPLCLGGGVIAYGPWGRNPPKKKCPACKGAREIREEDLAAVKEEYRI